MARVKKHQPKRGPEFRAQVVAEAKASTIDDAARRHNVSRRSVQRWMKDARDDAEMAHVVARKTELIEQDWADTAKAAMRDLLGSLVETVKKAQAEDGPVPPGRIHEMAGAVKVVGELGVAKEMFGSAAGATPAVVVTDGRPTEDDRTNAASGEGAAIVPIRPRGLRSTN